MSELGHKTTHGMYMLLNRIAFGYSETDGHNFVLSLGSIESAIRALDLLMICQVCLRLVDSDNWIAFSLKSNRYKPLVNV